jgi:SAM-dependent methyltransferase
MIYSHYSEYMSKAMSAGRPGPDPGEYEFLLKYLTANEPPFLELACGYGRLLLHMMEKGFTVVGTDSSPEMLAQCRYFAEKKGLKPVLHQQFMQCLELDQRFGFIFLADGGLTLIVEDDDIQDLFKRVWNHLKPDGTFLFDFFRYDPKAPATSNLQTNGWRQISDSTLWLSRKISSYDPATGRTERVQVHDLYEDGKFVGSQAYEDPQRDHDPQQLMETLKTLGFTDIRLGGDNTDSPPEPDASLVSIRCKRPR